MLYGVVPERRSLRSSSAPGGSERMISRWRMQPVVASDSDSAAATARIVREPLESDTFEDPVNMLHVTIGVDAPPKDVRAELLADGAVVEQRLAEVAALLPRLVRDFLHELVRLRARQPAFHQSQQHLAREHHAAR